jgi:hypothetical protein
MIRMFLVLAVASALLAPALGGAHAAPVAAPAAEQQQPDPFDPVGIYDFTTEVQGTPVTGALTLRRNEEGRLIGQITTDMTGEMPLHSITLEGRRAIMRATTPDGELYMQIDFLEDDRITGGWELSTGMAGSMSGQRRKDGV